MRDQEMLRSYRFRADGVVWSRNLCPHHPVRSKEDASRDHLMSRTPLLSEEGKLLNRGYRVCGATSVFSSTSRLQFGHLAGISRM